MHFDFRYFNPLGRLSFQKRFNQLSTRLFNVSRRDKVRLKDLLVQFVCVRVFEGQISDRHRVKNHAQTPQICVNAEVTLSGDHLWRSITRRPTGCL